MLAIFGAKRSPLLPDVPTLIEQGYKVDTGDAWTGMWAPAKTPKDELERMQAALKQVLDMPEVRDILINKQTLQPDFQPGAAMDKLQRKELAYWGAGDQGNRLQARAVSTRPAAMSLNGTAYIVGAYEHPTRKADDAVGGAPARRRGQGRARGRRPDARTTSTATSAPATRPGLGTTTMAEYLGLKLRHVDSTECGGSAPILHVAHAAAAIAAGRCNVALITLAGRPRAAMAEAQAKAAAAAGDGKDPKAVRPPLALKAARSRRAGTRLRAALRPGDAEPVRASSPGATCTSSAPPASSSPGSRWPRRTTRSTTRTPCCATWSRWRT